MTHRAFVAVCSLPFLAAAADTWGSGNPDVATRYVESASGEPLCEDYLGQELPGLTPALFAPGIVSTDLGMYGTVVFTSDQSEAYWVADESLDMWWSRRVGGCWTEPGVLPLLEGHRINSPVLSADDQRLYFLANKHNASGPEAEDRIWYTDRTPDGWSEPRCLGPAVNGTSKHFQFSVDSHGDIYFGGGSTGGDIHVARREGDTYRPAEMLVGSVNSEAPDMDPCLSPDAECLVLTRFLSSPPGAFLFASFRQPAGDWSDPVMLSEVLGTHGNDSGARFSPDGRYLFFQSCRPGSEPNRSVFWVDARILDEIR